MAPSPDRSEPAVLADVDSLLAAVGVSDLGGLEGVLYAWSDDPDMWASLEPGGALVIGSGATGLEVEFPTTVDAFWETADLLGAIRSAELAWRWIADQVSSTEGLVVEIDGQEPADGRWRRPEHADEYPFDEPADGRWSVAEWAAARFGPTYPGLRVSVLRPDGTEARASERLADLRDW